MAPGDDQRGTARLATVGALIVVASFVASKAARDAILLSHFNVKMLPIFIAISAVISLPIIIAAGKLMTRYGPHRLVPVLNLASALFALGEWLLLQRFPRPVAVVVFFHFATAGAVLVSGFWSIVNERFDVQSAKRHIGRIGIGATLGGIFGGVIAERTAVHLSPDKILLVLAGLQLVCAVMLYLFGRTARREAVVSEEDTWLAFRVVTRSRLLRNVGGIVVLVAIAGGVIDYVFKADIVAAASRDGLLRSLAIFYTVTNILTSVVQIVACGPLITRLGVPKSVGTLPVMLTATGLFALAVPVPLAAAIARGAELVTRNSVFRAGYELLYAPLPEEHKRPTKVVLDVGADRIGDVLGAQLVGSIVYLMAEPRSALLIAMIITGALTVLLAIRLPRSYRQALEDSLLARANEQAADARPSEPEPWITLDGLPSFGQASDIAPLSLRIRDRPARRKRPPPEAAGPPAAGPPAAPAAPAHDGGAGAVADLRSQDPERIRRALAGLTPELAAYAVDLVGRDEVASDTLAALAALAPRCTGLLVDALLDQERPVTVRRRLPGVLLSGEPGLAGWGLWRALLDPSFDVRYRAGAVLARMCADGQLGPIAADDVFKIVRRELMTDAERLVSRRILDDLVTAAEQRSEDDPVLQRAGTGLEHVFTLLGLALPAEPLRIALHAVQTDDPELRGTALEYLESILPPDVRAQLWPLLEGEPGLPAIPATSESAASLAADVADDVETPEALEHLHAIRAVAPVALPAPELLARKPRTPDEIVAALRLSYPSILEKLRQRARPA
jgi:hypothetical protein